MVHVDLHLVEARRSQGEPHQPVDTDHPPPARRQREGMQQAARADVFRLGALTDLTSANISLISQLGGTNLYIN